VSSGEVCLFAYGGEVSGGEISNFKNVTRGSTIAPLKQLMAPSILFKNTRTKENSPVKLMSMHDHNKKNQCIATTCGALYTIQKY
jgi:hypothetical protein